MCPLGVPIVYPMLNILLFLDIIYSIHKESLFVVYTNVKFLILINKGSKLRNTREYEIAAIALRFNLKLLVRTRAFSIN